MKMRTLLAILLLQGPAFEAHAQICAFTFPTLSTCTDSDCKILIDVLPRGVARVFPDATYGTQLGINFGIQSVFDLGDNGRINFGSNGGKDVVFVAGSGVAFCRDFTSGFQAPYTVEMANGGWLDFTGSNRIELNPNNVIVLGAGSKIDGRLDIQGEGTVNVGSTGDMAMPNVDIQAENGITLSGQGDLQIGNLQNQGTPSENQGITINADGSVTIGIVDGNDDFSVMAGGDITVEEIRNAGSISLAINPPGSGGVITIGGQQTTANPVMCSPPDDCSNFQLQSGNGGPASDPCNTVNSDPSAVNNCPGGGATGPGFILLSMAAFFLRRRINKNNAANPSCSPPPDASV